MSAMSEKERRSVMRDLENRAVLVTGAASGIGRATAIAFAHEGADPLLLNDIDEEGLAETAAVIERAGRTAILLPADVSDSEAVDAMVASALAQAGRIDVLVNVAGVGIFCPVECISLEDWRHVLGVDLWGVIHTVSAVYPHMIDRGEGHILNVASVNGLLNPALYLASYAAAKFAVVGFSEALMQEARQHGVGVSVVCPGGVNTPIKYNAGIKGFSERARSLTNLAFKLGQQPEDTAHSMVRAVQRDRFLTVTTLYAKSIYFFRRHFQFLYYAYMRRLSIVLALAFKRYRE